LRARIHGYLPEDFIGTEYHSLTDNFTCDEMYTVESDICDARAEISTLSPAEAIEEFGFTLMKGSPIVFLGCFLVGSSRVDLQACKLEYSIVSPK